MIESPILDSHAAAPGLQPWLSPEETVAYLRLENQEQLRNLIRRHGLPVCKRGHLRLFRRADIDAWLISPHSRRRRT
jgi:excisionase family DNA binding protein